MKVVINRCFGGFGLSHQAVEECLRRGMTVTTYKGSDLVNPEADFVRDEESILGICDCYNKAFRSNPIMVAVVEELGKAANDRCAELSVIDIPFDNIEGWYIEEYDGMEHVAQKHDRWY